MLKFYLDTSFLINLLRGVDTTKEFVLKADGLFIVPAVVYYEFLAGIELLRLKGKPAEDEEIFIESLYLEDLTKDSLKEASKIRAMCRTKGMEFGDADYLIAGQVVHGSGILVTFDKDFAEISKIYRKFKVKLLRE